MRVLQKTKIVALGLMIALGLGIGCVARPAMAFDVSECPGYDAAQKKGDTTMYNENPTSLADCYVHNDKGNLMDVLQRVLNVIFGVIGFIAVVMLVYGGIQYTISSGDAGKVKKAKDTILYGIVGLVIALLAAAIVNFVLAGVFQSN